MEQLVQYVEINGIKYPRAIKKVPTSLRRKQSDSNLTGSSDQMHVTPHYLRPKGVTCVSSMMMISQRISRILARHYWKGTRPFLKTLYFAIIYSRRLAGR